MATHSSILAWEILQTEEPGSPWGGKESDTTKATNTHRHTHTDTPLSESSCLLLCQV